MTTPKFLNTEKAAEMLGIHPMTLKMKARSGEIPAGKSGRKWVFLDVDLVEYIRAQYKTANDQEIEVCHSINAKIRHIGGSKLNKTEESYLEALGLKTAVKHKNITTN